MTYHRLFASLTTGIKGNHMNKLKKLFSPTTLGATIATGLLLASVTVALADTYSSPTHDSSNYCNQNAPNGEGTLACYACGYQCAYWCCQYPGYSCGDIDQVNTYPQWGWCNIISNP